MVVVVATNETGEERKGSLVHNVVISFLGLADCKANRKQRRKEEGICYEAIDIAAA